MSPIGSAASRPAHERAIWIHNKAAQMLLSFSASVDGALSLLDVMSVLIQRSLIHTGVCLGGPGVGMVLVTHVGYQWLGLCGSFISLYSGVCLLLGICHVMLGRTPSVWGMTNNW